MDFKGSKIVWEQGGLYQTLPHGFPAHCAYNCRVYVKRQGTTHFWVRAELQSDVTGKNYRLFEAPCPATAIDRTIERAVAACRAQVAQIEKLLKLEEAADAAWAAM